MAVFKDNWNGYEGKKWRVQIRYEDWQGKKREHNKRGLATKKEALEYEREFLAKKSRDINMAFGTFIDQYLEDLKPQIKLNTYHTKVPHKAIMNYILHYTKPSDIVFDVFGARRFSNF